MPRTCWFVGGRGIIGDLAVLTAARGLHRKRLTEEAIASPGKQLQSDTRSLYHRSKVELWLGREAAAGHRAKGPVDTGALCAEARHGRAVGRQDTALQSTASRRCDGHARLFLP